MKMKGEKQGYIILTAADYYSQSLSIKLYINSAD
jgi:hypothetical protein